MSNSERQPNPPSQELVSEADIQALKSEAFLYNNIYLETIYDDGGNLRSVSQSYQHLMGNLAWMCQIILKDHPENRTLAKHQSFVQDIFYIKKYLKLLEDFPDFKAKEMSQGVGYFPEIKTSDYKERIDKYEALLRG